MSDIAKLREDHAELIEIIRRLAAAIEADIPPSPLELYDIRRELASTLIAHLKAEDWALYPRLLESKDREVASTARAFSDEMGGLAEAFGLYSQRWGAMAIQIDWPGFRSDTKAIIDALTCRITRENRDLYPLIERLDRAA